MFLSTAARDVLRGDSSRNIIVCMNKQINSWYTRLVDFTFETHPVLNHISKKLKREGGV